MSPGVYEVCVATGMVLRYAHLAPAHLADAATRIEKPLGIVEHNPTSSLR